MKTTDVITFTPDIFQEINVETYNAITDDNINRVFKLLRENNYLTISDIVTELEKSDNPKSESSIYRYLQKLISLKIAVKAGKRIYLNQDITVRSEPLYSLTAKAFIQDIRNILDNDRKRYHEIVTYSCDVLKQLYPNRELDGNKIKDILTKHVASTYDQFKKIQFGKNEEEKKFLQGLDFDEIIFLYDTIRWFSLLLDDDFIANFTNIVRKK